MKVLEIMVWIKSYISVIRIFWQKSLKYRLRYGNGGTLSGGRCQIYKRDFKFAPLTLWKFCVFQKLLHLLNKILHVKRGVGKIKIAKIKSLKHVDRLWYQFFWITRKTRKVRGLSRHFQHCMQISRISKKTFFVDL